MFSLKLCNFQSLYSSQITFQRFLMIIYYMFQPRFLDIVDTTSERDYISNHTGKTKSKKQKSPFHSDAYSNYDQKEPINIPSSFLKEEYPADFAQANPFCAFCGKFISKAISFVVYHCQQRRKKYLLHDSCVKSNEGRHLAFTEAAEARLQSVSFLNHPRSIALGGKEFYFQMQVLHPFGGFSFLKIWTKLKSIGSLISWQLKNLQEADSFCPNIIAFPLPEFQIQLTLIEMGEKDGKTTKKASVSVGRLGGKEVQYVKAFTDDIQITMRVIGTKQQQAKTIDQMNMKYRYPTQTGTSLIELIRVQVKLPAGQSDDSQQEFQSRGNSRITQQMSQRSSFRDERSIHNSEALSQRSFDRQKVDLQKLVSSGKLNDYVRQNTQSRVFQSWLSQASPHEVDKVISSLWQELPQLITHEYANYMVQKLLSVCTLAQRLRIVQRLQVDIPGIARNKQGTHSLQTLIALFTGDEEYQLVCDSIRGTYLSLAQHPNATHFLQKIINLFPLTHTIDFIQIVNSDFLSFALDKNAMCVIKQMIKRVSQLQNSGKGGQAPQARRQFVHSVNFNIDKIIGDPYGNYILQFCYQLFGEDRCGAITDRIIDKFTQFSLQKYSSAVVYKCVNTYWTNKDTLQKLKISLNADSIIEMFRNKDANKILLQIMQRHEGSALREKIQSQLMMGELTKFNHERWGVALGSRSGIVGTQFKNFSQAIKKSPTKKKKYYNNIH